jgi:hypothetical protein
MMTTSSHIITICRYSQKTLEPIEEVHVCWKAPQTNVLYFRIPFEYDLLLNVTVDGDFERAELFQHHWKRDKTVYASVSGGSSNHTKTMTPFPYSGVPYNPEVFNKNFIVAVYAPKEVHQAINVTIGVAFCDSASRRLCWGRKDLKLVHETGTIYQNINGYLVADSNVELRRVL